MRGVRRRRAARCPGKPTSSSQSRWSRRPVCSRRRRSRRRRWRPQRRPASESCRRGTCRKGWGSDGGGRKGGRYRRVRRQQVCAAAAPLVGCPTCSPGASTLHPPRLARCTAAASVPPFWSPFHALTRSTRCCRWHRPARKSLQTIGPFIMVTCAPRGVMSEEHAWHANGIIRQPGPHIPLLKLVLQQRHAVLARSA